jgi:hypothetical protein
MKEINGINFSKTSRFRGDKDFGIQTGTLGTCFLVLATAEEAKRYSRVIFLKRTGAKN